MFVPHLLPTIVADVILCLCLLSLRCLGVRHFFQLSIVFVRKGVLPCGLLVCLDLVLLCFVLFDLVVVAILVNMRSLVILVRPFASLTVCLQFFFLLHVLKRVPLVGLFVAFMFVLCFLLFRCTGGPLYCKAWRMDATKIAMEPTTSVTSAPHSASRLP